MPHCKQGYKQNCKQGYKHNYNSQKSHVPNSIIILFHYKAMGIRINVLIMITSSMCENKELVTAWDDVSLLYQLRD